MKTTFLVISAVLATFFILIPLLFWSVLGPVSVFSLIPAFLCAVAAVIVLDPL